MNPGQRDTLIKVYNRVQSQGDFGPSLMERELIGCYWAAITFVTKSLVYSGNEVFRPGAIWPMPVVRFIFELDTEFDFATVEFLYNGFYYCPREPGIRLGSARGSMIAYNCIRQLPGEPVDGPGAGSGSGSGSG